MKASPEDLNDISDELNGIDYGELHIHIRGGEIISYSTIKSRLKQNYLTNDKQYANADNSERIQPNRKTGGSRHSSKMN